jgi:Tfp pilus assembly protein PilF
VREQDYAKAEQQFRDCIQVSPGFDQAYLNLARLYMMQNDKARAKAVLEDLLRVQPGNANAKQAMDALSSMQ